MTDWAVLRAELHGALSVAECEWLADLAAGSDATRALEVGHYTGLSTCVLLEALPPDCELVTIDHHRGDLWSGATSPIEYLTTVAPFAGDRPFQFLDQDMRTALPVITEPFGFVFYDADHTAQGVADFWRLAQPLLAHECVLVYDDGDWSEQSTLGTFAVEDGFAPVYRPEFVRYDDDKRDPRTYTLEVLAR